MRYLIIIIIALFSALLTGGVSPQIPILGAEPDFLLCVMLAMKLRDKTVTPVIICSVSAIFIDAFFAHAIGYYSLPYAVVGFIVGAVFSKRKAPLPFFIPPLVCAAAWLAKDILSAIISFFMGNTFDFFYIFVHNTLPGMLVNAVIFIPIYLLIIALYRTKTMIPRAIGIGDEFAGIEKRRR